MQKSYLNILENGEEIFVKDPMATKGKAGLLPSLRVSQVCLQTFYGSRSQETRLAMRPLTKIDDKVCYAAVSRIIYMCEEQKGD